MIGAGDEAARPLAGTGSGDAVTVAFGDAEADVFGMARIGLVLGEDGAPRASGLALLFAGREPVAARMEGGISIDGEPSWSAIEAAGIRMTIEEPLAAWTCAFGGSPDGGFELELRAVSPALPFSEPGGQDGYEQLCEVRGVVTVHGQRIEVECLGQRGHAWGTPDWDKIALARSVSAWTGEGTGLALHALRSAKAKHHDEEALIAYLVGMGEHADAEAPAPVEDPRLSTTYDGEGRQRRVGLELWEHEESDFPSRASGEALCGTTLDLGRLRMDLAFFRMTVNGRPGVGRYELLRRA